MRHISKSFRTRKKHSMPPWHKPRQARSSALQVRSIWSDNCVITGKSARTPRRAENVFDVHELRFAASDSNEIRRMQGMSDQATAGGSTLFQRMMQRRPPVGDWMG